MGPYLPAEIPALFGAVSPSVMACNQFDYDSGRPQWRNINLVVELSSCVRAEVPRSLPVSPPPQPDKCRLNILSTDDDSGIRVLLWNMLSDDGHNVDFAKDGEEVFKRLAVKNYDLVILDVNMPKMNGYKVSELLHEKLHNPPKVIIFTGRNIEDERLQFVCSGADAILNKGTGNTKLLETIDGLFKQAPPVPAEIPSAVIEPQPPIMEEFYPSPAAEEPAPAVAVPAHERALDMAPEPSSPPPGAVKLPAPTGIYVPGGQVNARDGELKPIFDRLIAENKGLKDALADVRRLLGHMQLEYEQLSSSVEKKVLKGFEINRTSIKELKTEWRTLRVSVLLAALLLAAVVGYLTLCCW